MPRQSQHVCGDSSIYRGSSAGPRYSSMGRALRNDLNQGSKRDTYNPLYVLHERNSGWPCLREQKGHGAVIVLVGVMPDQGVEESSIQGEAPQGVQQLRRCWRVMRQ